MNYKVGNIVRLKDDKFREIKEDFLFPQNLFYIKNVDNVGKTMFLGGFFGPDINYDDIEPVKIDGKEDRNIYFDVNAYNADHKEDNSVSNNMQKYFMESLKEESLALNIDFDEIHYVHQIQNRLPEIGKHLKIHYFIDTKVEKRETRYVRIKDIGNVVIKKKYEELIGKDDSIKTKGKVFIKKQINLSDEIASNFANIPYTYVLICNDKNKYRSAYYSFYLESTIGRIGLLNGEVGNVVKGNTKISYIKDMPIAIIEDYVSACCVFQSFMELLVGYSQETEKNKNDIQPFYDFLSKQRNAMAMELSMPDFFDKFNIKILDNWIQELNHLVPILGKVTNDKSLLEVLTRYFRSLFSSGNELMRNMNKYRLYSQELLDLIALRINK